MKHRLLFLVVAVTLAAQAVGRDREADRCFTREVFAKQDSLQEVYAIQPEAADLTVFYDLLNRTADPVHRSVLHTLLAQMNQSMQQASVNRRDADKQEELQRRYTDHLSRILDDMPALMDACAADFDSLIALPDDTADYALTEHIYHGDLLHILAQWVIKQNGQDGLYDTVAVSYCAHGNEQAASLFSLPKRLKILSNRCTDKRQLVDSLDAWLAQPLPLPARKTIQAVIDVVCQPFVQMEPQEQNLLVNRSFPIQVILTNTDSALLTITHKASDKILYRVPLYADYTGRDKRLADDTLSVPVTLPAGDYHCTLSAYNRTEVRSIHMTSLILLKVNANGRKSRFIAVNRETGRPEPQVKWEYKNNNVRAVLNEQDYTDWAYIGKAPSYQPDRVTFHSQLFANRTLLRAGQTLHINAVLWQQDNRTEIAQVLSKTAVKFLLHDPEGKTTVLKRTTNSFGSADVDFVLPREAVPGRYTVECADQKHKSNNSFLSFTVAEYKRPTFEVQAEGACQDSMVRFHGTAVTLSGLPVSEAQVRYTLHCQHYFFRGWNSVGNSFTGNCVTDSEGHFVISDSLLHFMDGPCDYLHIVLTADVTAPNGETQQATAFARVTFKPYRLETDISDDVLDLSKQPALTLTARDAAGNNVSTIGSATLTHDGQTVAQWSFVLGQPYTLPDTLPCGKYTLTAVTERDTLTHNLRLFNPTTLNRRPLFNEDFAYSPQVTWTAQGMTIYFAPQERDCYLFAYVSTSQGIIDSLRQVVPEGIVPLHFAPPADADAATVHLLYVRNGHSWSGQFEFSRPQPQPNLQLQLSSFRNVSSPGAKEKWTVRLTDTCGHPATGVELCAALYDAALDRLAAHKNTWKPSLSFARALYYTSLYWSGGNQNLYASLYHTIAPYLPAVGRWEGFTLQPYPLTVRNNVVLTGMTAKAAVRSDNVFEFEEEVNYELDALSEKDEPVHLRTDFREDPLWLPHLVTGTDGIAHIAVTLPDALTEWRLLLMAHDKTMQYASTDTTLVVRKALSVNPMWPRFIRRGDTIVWAASVQNRTDAEVRGTARIELRSRDSLTVWAEHSLPLSVAAGATEAVTFTLPADYKSDTLLATVTFAGNGNSDGEQVLVPILSDTLPLRRDIVLTVQQSPEQLLREAVREVQTPRLDCATDCALAIYIGRQKGLSTLAAQDKLRRLQHDDGSFSWCENMEGSSFITLAVVRMLLMTGGVMMQETDKALQWLDRQELQHFQSMQQQGGSFVVSDATIEYLLLSARAGHPSDSVRAMQQTYWNELDRQALRLTDRRAARRTPYTIYGVAMLADTYLRKGQKNEAAACLDHLIHYSVFREGFGRYYATDAALYNWMDYKLPTQLAAVQALMGASGRQDTVYDTYTAQMLLWVLRQKQTQQWHNPVNILTAAELVKQTRHTAVGRQWQLMLEASEDTYADNAMKISCRPLNDTLCVGDRVTLRTSVTADRDMDFVKVTVPLPACLEPVQSLSGYRYLGSVWGYVAQYDDHADIYLQRFPTGTCTLDLDFFVVRAGTYSAPPAQVVCTYNPAFHAKTENQKLKIGTQTSTSKPRKIN